MTEPARQPTFAQGHTPWTLVLLLGALTAFGPVSIDLYLPALPSMANDLSASAGQSQASLSSFFAGMAVGQFIWGSASDRRGRRGPILIGIIVYLAASTACALATSPDLLITARFFQALGACAGPVVARAAVRDQFDHQDTARILSLLTLVMGVAPIVAPLIGGFILPFGWRANFWVMTGFGLALLVWCLISLKETRTPEAQVKARGEAIWTVYATLSQNRRLLGYILAGALNGAALFTYIAASPDLVIQTYGFPAREYGYIFAVNAAGLIGCSQLNRYLLRTHTTDQVLSVSSRLAAVVSIAMVVFAFTGWGGYWGVLLCIFLALSTYGLMQANTMAGALSLDPHRAGSISALLGAASFATGAVFSATVGLFHDGTARPMAISIMIGMVGSAIGLHVLSFRRDRS